jgi:hypothetical protein
MNASRGAFFAACSFCALKCVTGFLQWLLRSFLEISDGNIPFSSKLFVSELHCSDENVQFLGKCRNFVFPTLFGVGLRVPEMNFSIRRRFILCQIAKRKRKPLRSDI